MSDIYNICEEPGRLPNLNGAINRNGSRVWTDEYGELHREGNPAIVYQDGGNDWYQHGKLHREDGPAYNYSSSTNHPEGQYWINDVELTKDEWIDYLKSGESTLKQSVISRLILENS